MTFNDFINSQTEKKIIIFEIDEPYDMNESSWVQHDTNIWKADYTWEPSIPVTEEGSSIYFDVNDDRYTRVYNLTDLEENCFYIFDEVIYVYYNKNFRDENVFKTTGIIIGYSTEARYFNDIYYESRIVSIPNIRNTRDDTFQGTIIFEGGNVVLNNNDGVFDHFDKKNIYGKNVKIKFGGGDLEYNDYREVYSGYIYDWSLKGEKVSISVKDERKRLKKSIPDNIFSLNDYPYMESVYSGTLIPVGYGRIRSAIATCVNGTAVSPPFFLFQFIDVTYHNISAINAVYVDGVEVTFSDSYIDYGMFELSPSEYQLGQIVTVDFDSYRKDVEYPNLISSADESTFRGYPENNYGVQDSDGYWMLDTKDNHEFLMANYYTVEEEETYTESFKLKIQSGTTILNGVNITFFTPTNSHNIVPANIIPLGNNEYFVYASVQTRVGDTSVRAIDFYIDLSDDTEIGIKESSLTKTSFPVDYFDNGVTDFLIENPLSIIEDLFLNYSGIKYNNVNYNVESWVAEKQKVPIVAWLEMNGNGLMSIIGNMTSSFGGTLKIDGDGRINMKILDDTKPPVKTIKIDELKKPTDPRYGRSELITTAKVSFNRGWSSGRNQWYVNDSRENDIYNIYRQYYTKSFLTVLVNEEDAQAYSEKLLNIWGSAVKKFNIVTDIQNVDLEINDIIDVEAYRFENGKSGVIRGEVTSISTDYSKGICDITLRYITDVSDDLETAKLIKGEIESKIFIDTIDVFLGTAVDGEYLLTAGNEYLFLYEEEK
jgi:hypothetical protein